MKRNPPRVSRCMLGTRAHAQGSHPRMTVAFGVVGGVLGELRHRLDVERSLGRRDLLTGLANGRAFRESAELLMSVARRGERPFTIAYLDLDNFKTLNDRHGHATGTASTHPSA